MKGHSLESKMTVHITYCPVKDDGDDDDDEDNNHFCRKKMLMC